jgi:acyl-coenzyme A synthetase/AMP-(fatty) acid ligase
VSASSGYRLRGSDLAARGEATALVSQTARITYAELARRAAGVWRQLAKVGILPGDPVALLSAARGHDEPVAFCGILTIGAVAVPLDATAPPGRLARIARARHCRAIVVDQAGLAIAGAIQAHFEVNGWESLSQVVLDAEGHVSAPLSHPAPAPHDGVRDTRLACILHTSGSTGAPKPVPFTWEGIDAFTGWMIDRIGLSPSDRVLRVAELIFDMAWFDHIATFRAGAALATMTRRDLAAGRALRDAVQALRPTVIYGVPSLFIKLVSALAGSECIPAPVRAILFGGEVFPPRELLGLAQRAPGAELHNLYGPTETNACTAHRIDRDALDGKSEIPIGTACPYATCRIVAEDGSGHIVQGPGTGELVVEGPTTVGGGPYATRDRIERGSDGLFYFRGRIDRMVKIRGYRVEPGEVEAALSAHPCVQQAAVVTHDEPRVGKTLRAFVTLRGDAADASERAIRIFLSERLPPYMVPDKVTAIGAMPLTPTGKIDYQALR